MNAQWGFRVATASLDMQGAPRSSVVIRRCLRIVSHSVIVLCCVLFLVSGLEKLADIESFNFALRGWTLVPPAARVAATVLVPGLEIAVGVMGLFATTRLAGATGALLLIVVFLLAYQVQSGVSVPARCGCGGVTEGLRRRFESQGLHRWNLLLGGTLATATLAAAYSASVPTHRRPTP